MKKNTIITIDCSTGSYREFLDAITSAGKDRKSSYVCVANVHMCIEAYLDPDFARIVNGADITTPDGMPLIHALRIIHRIEQQRVAGMDLLPDLIATAERQGLSIFFYGSTDEVLARVVARIRREHPGTCIAGVFSPPFRPLSEVEEDESIKRINGSGAHLVIVALGCPKQERWMERMRGRIDAVMLGVGGALPVYAGMQKRAPVWMQRASLEWLYRLCQEPRRLFRRYLVTNNLFLLLLAREWWRVRLRPRPRDDRPTSCRSK